jgi:hypothetical protein
MTFTCAANHLTVEMTNAPRDCSPKRVLTSPTCQEVVMASVHICAVDDCGKRVVARGWCSAHYQKWRAYGSPLVARHARPGEPLEWLEKIALRHVSDECLIWPFARTEGYGRVWVDGRSTHAHRVVCERTHGPAPKGKSDAAHSCGNGHLGCVSPRHLTWKDRSGNHADKVQHGTDDRGEKHYAAKLTAADVLSVRNEIKSTPVRDLAERYGVSEWSIKDAATGRNWGWLR